MRNYVRLVLATAFVLSAATMGHTIPQMINYQGVLKGSDGNPVTTAVNVLFNIWNAPTGGTAQWSETQSVTPDSEGRFNVLLGSITPIPYSAFAGDAWMSIRVAADPEMAPRTQVVSVSYAYYPGTVDGAAGGTISGNVDIQGDLTVAGKATIGSGNTNTGSSAFVAGQNNAVTGIAATVGGGSNNKARGIYSTIAGGGGTAELDSNLAMGDYSVIGGGVSNTTRGFYNAISGGALNTTSGVLATVGGGRNNAADGDRATVAGGGDNVADTMSATVSGGSNNRARGIYSTVAGGGGSAEADSNSALGDYSAISGGVGNTAHGGYNAIGGGARNTTGVDNTSAFRYATVGGGADNKANGSSSTVGGGGNNTASGIYATVCGGVFNAATGIYATACGGGFNAANGSRSMVCGGQSNIADGDYSFAAGRQAKANDDGAFVWADDNGSLGFPSTAEANFTPAANMFLARVTGGAVFVSGIDGSGNSISGVKLAAGGGAWGALSNRDAKANFETVDGRDVLERLADISIQTWNYRSQSPAIRHIGPMAQDFYAAFGVGEDNRYITTIDADGIALAAIQELHKRNDELTASNHRLESELAALREIVESLLAEK